MKDEIVERLTNTPKRTFLYHFTRVDNLASMASLDTLYASDTAHPNPRGERRSSTEVYEVYGHPITLNAHLYISSNMMDSDTSVGQFRAFLDQHVFLWPTLPLCQQMLQMYTRREPHERFAVLQFDARPLLRDHYDVALLSKYDAGSMPRYPKRTSYRKTLRMFLRLDDFGERHEPLVPRIPSQIHEILIHNAVSPLHRYLRTVYCTDVADVPNRWTHLYKPLKELQMPGLS